ncbi:MAG: azurin [Bacteroidetes bacterium]|nr:MAG: azurin [Bacteroidota bacterium]
MKTHALKLFSFAVMGAMMISCGGGESEKSAEPASSTEPTTETPAETPAETTPEMVELTITGNDQMQFDLSKMEVIEGQTVRLTFKNIGTMPVESMGHNWTLFVKDADISTYATKAIDHKEDGYQVPDMMDQVLVHTRILGPGEEETITFTAPEKGIYKYVCTFPGHYALMKGTFLVKGK